MKIYNKLMIAAGVAVSMGFSSCVGDLDLLPTDPRDLTPGQFQENPEQYMTAVMADIYMQFATYGANGNSSFAPSERKRISPGASTAVKTSSFDF